MRAEIREKLSATGFEAKRLWKLLKILCIHLVIKLYMMIIAINKDTKLSMEQEKFLTKKV